MDETVANETEFPMLFAFKIWLMCVGVRVETRGLCVWNSDTWLPVHTRVAVISVHNILVPVNQRSDRNPRCRLFSPASAAARSREQSGCGVATRSREQ